MFKYGKKAGYMGIALLVLAVIPLVVAACVIPNIGPEVATKFNAAGDALGQELRAAGASGAQSAAERGNVLYGGTPGKKQRGLRCDGTPCVRALPA